MAFQKGISGNPKGRPSNNISVAMMRNHIYEALPEILAALVTQAKNGDVNAARLLLDRTIPILKPATEPVCFDIAANDTPTATAQALIDSMSRAEISPDAATAAIEALIEREKLAVNQATTQKLIRDDKDRDKFSFLYD